MKRPIYLDHHATTPVDERVLRAMEPWWREDFGNASSASHAYGWRAEAAVEQAREQIAAAIGARDPREIVFTSGATESDNLALFGVLGASRGDHLVTCAVEHPAVLDTARALAARGARLTELSVDAGGLVDPDVVAAAIREGTALVSVGAANGEVGTLQPVAAIGARCREAGVPFHSDAAQAVGKIDLDVERDQIDLLSFSAHKLYGPKGVGALYVRGAGRGPKLVPMIHGGGHERGLRSGTLPVPLVVGFAAAVTLCAELRVEESARLAALRDRLHARLREGLAGVQLNGAAAPRLPANLNLSFEGVRSDVLLPALHDIALSTGSACASARGEPSHVLRALGLSAERVAGAVRFGLGRDTSEAEIDSAAVRVAEEVEKARSGAPQRGLRRAREG